MKKYAKTTIRWCSPGALALLAYRSTSGPASKVATTVTISREMTPRVKMRSA